MFMLSKILRLFINTLTADDKYSLLNRDNLTQPIQIILCQKQTTFFHFFSSSLKCAIHFEHFQKQDDPHSRYISEITASKKDN